MIGFAPHDEEVKGGLKMLGHDWVRRQKDADIMRAYAERQRMEQEAMEQRQRDREQKIREETEARQVCLPQGQVAVLFD